jgi:NADH:ubiquinone oxidoreductase subunit F (NADH-binding)/(2Fe-2S) ferredoxin
MSTLVTERGTAVRDALARAMDPDGVVAHEGAVEVRICAGTACHASGRPAVTAAFKEEFASRGLADRVAVVETGCHGFCEQGPIVVLQPKGIFYAHVRADDVAGIISASIEGDGFYEKRLYKHPQTGEPLPYEKDIPFYRGQRRLVLTLNGKIDPRSIDDYLSHEGYVGLATVLAADEPDKVIDTIAESGLRSRGGAGSPTGAEWKLAREARGSEKYVICNADEGDPGAFNVRSVLEGNPHVVLEGMAIAAFAIGAREGYVSVRAEYPYSVDRLRRAIEQARERGIFGDHVLGTDFSFDVHINKGAGAFVCGEETALMASIEGKRGAPRTRPPLPAVEGLWGKPTSHSTTSRRSPTCPGSSRTAPRPSSHGQDVARHQGLLPDRQGHERRPRGGPHGRHASPRDLQRRRRHAAGPPFQGGPARRPFRRLPPEKHLHLPVTFDSLQDAGAMWARRLVDGRHDCMVDVARFFTSSRDESCGKCVPSVSHKRMFRPSTASSPRGREGDIELLEELSEYISEGALCALGGTAPNPVLTALRYFRDEFEAHIKEKRCPAGRCKALQAPVAQET